MNSQGIGVIGWVIVLLVAAGFVLLIIRVASPYLHRAKMRTAVRELLEKDFESTDSVIRAKIIDAGRSMGTAIEPTDIIVSRPGGKKLFRIEVDWSEQIDLYFVRWPIAFRVEEERDISWAKGVIDRSREAADQVTEETTKRLENALP